MKSRWVVVLAVGLLSFWTACRQPMSGPLEGTPAQALPTGPIETASTAPTPSPVETPPASDRPEPETLSEAALSEEGDTPAPDAPPSETVEQPDAEAVEPPQETESPAGMIPQFKAERPERLTMPVPVFPENVDFETVVPGWVEFRVQIDAAGHVLEAEVLDSSHPDLEGPARSAIEVATYTPVKDPRGIPLMVSFVDRVNF